MKYKEEELMSCENMPWRFDYVSDAINAEYSALYDYYNSLALYLVSEKNAIIPDTREAAGRYRAYSRVLSLVNRVRTQIWHRLVVRNQMGLGS